MNPIYLDYAATTPVREEVRQAMEPLLSQVFGNPSSRHRWGRAAAARLTEARERTAAALGVEPQEVIFVRGGTESDNLAILGRAAVARERGERPLVAVSALEHKAVLEAAERVDESDGECVVLGVDAEEGFDFGALEAVLARRPAVVSTMWVNNEVGVVLPVPEIAERTRAAGVAFHTDAVQALGKLAIRPGDTAAELVTVTGHKIYGPKGTGLLVVRGDTEIAPRVFGGGQESRVRPGTEDVAGAVGLSVAVELAVAESEDEGPRLAALRERLEAGLTSGLDFISVHGVHLQRAPHILSVGVPGADQDAVLAGLDLEGIAVSGGSACDSGVTMTSHVLKALYGEEIPQGATVRYSLGRVTTEEDIEGALAATVQVLHRARVAST